MFQKVKPAKEVLFYRKNHVITNADDTVIFTGEFKDGDTMFPSVNAAKREMRKLVEANGPGSGRVKT